MKGEIDMYKKILVPLDGSELAECAVSHVKNILKQDSTSEVTLLNVFKVDLLPETSGFLDINARRAALLTESGNYLTGVECRLASESIKVKKESIEGNRPAETISDYAQKNDMDLIIIATHGYTGLKKLMFGSIALSILHDSHVPILLIRPEPSQT
jgi:nucleotide-binding universal stress UspA family protein